MEGILSVDSDKDYDKPRWTPDLSSYWSLEFNIVSLSAVQLLDSGHSPAAYRHVQGTRGVPDCGYKHTVNSDIFHK
jgi:hypothetical protein